MPASDTGEDIVEIHQVRSTQARREVPSRRRIDAEIGSLRYIEVGSQAARVICYVVEHNWSVEEHAVFLHKRLVDERHPCSPDGGCSAGATARPGSIRESLPLTAKVERQVERNCGNVRHFPEAARAIVLHPFARLKARLLEEVAVATATAP